MNMDKNTNYFIKALPIWAKEKSEEINSNCLFFTKLSQGTCSLTITANNFYRVFLNGIFVAYGPARASHDLYRVDKIQLNCDQNDNSLLIEVAGYNSKSFYNLDTPAFLQAEITKNNEVIAYTGKDFSCGLYEQRLQKVMRFSYQRSFTESYNFNVNPNELYANGPTNKVEVEILPQKKLIDRKINYPIFNENSFDFCEYGIYSVNPSLPVYMDRCMTTNALKIYPIDQLETNPSNMVSQFEYNLNEKTFNNNLTSKEYALYEFNRSLTGFIKISCNAKTDAHFLIIFEEVDLNENKTTPKNIKFNRNETVNIIEYKIRKGHFEHISFEPYTAKYIKVINLNGEICDIKVSLVSYENPDCDNLKFWCDNQEINLIIESAKNTFKQNAVDILTDCPSRERAGWLCDSFFSAKAEKLFTGKNLVENNFLENYILIDKHKDLPEKAIAMCYPADFSNRSFIPNWMMWYMIELYDHFIRTKETNLIDSSKKKVYDLIEFFKNYENENGLLENLPSWVFVEWSIANDREYVRGVNYPSNMLYGYALQLMGKLYNDNALIKKADIIFDTIRKESFNGEFFEDNRVRQDGKLTLKGHISETCQYYAFFTGVATKKLYGKLFDLLLNSFGPCRDDKKVYAKVGKSNAFIGDYLRLIILKQYGLFDKMAEESISYFAKMAKITGTLWEHDTITGSLNHGFASFIANILTEYLTGFEYADCKNNIIHVHPVNCKLDCSITIPLSNGKFIFERKNGKEEISYPKQYSTQL